MHLSEIFVQDLVREISTRCNCRQLSLSRRDTRVNERQREGERLCRGRTATHIVTVQTHTHTWHTHSHTHTRCVQRAYSLIARGVNQL